MVVVSEVESSSVGPGAVVCLPEGEVNSVIVSPAVHDGGIDELGDQVMDVG